MKIEKTEWHEDGMASIPELEEADSNISYGYSFEGMKYQPSFGIELGWNVPSKLWKPYLVVGIWHWKFQIGFLY